MLQQTYSFTSLLKSNFKYRKLTDSFDCMKKGASVYFFYLVKILQKQLKVEYRCYLPF